MKIGILEYRSVIQPRSSITKLVALSSILLIAAACGTSASHSAAKSSSAASPLDVKVILQPAAQGLPVIVAKQEGIFKKYGINVTTIAKQSNGALYPELVGNGQYDIADMPLTEFLGAKAQNINNIIIANEYQASSSYPLTFLIVAKNSSIRSLADLVGKTIATPSIAGNLWVSFQYALIKAGLSPSSVTGLVAPLPDMGADLAAGKVSAVLTLVPFSTILVSGGDKVLAEPYLSIGSHPNGQVFVANAPWAEAHKAKVKDFVAALAQANTYIKQHPATAAQDLSDFTGTPVSVTTHIPLPPYDFTITPSQVSQWQQVMLKVNPNPGLAKLRPQEMILNFNG